MCGFAGFLLGHPGGLDDPKGLATRMANAIAYWGPDDFGAWADAQAGIARSNATRQSQ
jgi:asparagine synthetase B (glutamine-hydrolysing)